MHAIVFVYTTVSSTWPAALLPGDTEPQLEGMHAASSLEFKSRSGANKRLKTSPVAAPYTAKSPATATGAPITLRILSFETVGYPRILRKVIFTLPN